MLLYNFVFASSSRLAHSWATNVVEVFNEGNIDNNVLATGLRKEAIVDVTSGTSGWRNLNPVIQINVVMVWIAINSIKILSKEMWRY